MWVRLRNFFVAGLIAILPAALTYLVLRWLVLTLDGSFGGPLHNFFLDRFGYDIPGVGLLGALILILLTGMLATNLVGRRIILSLELWLQKLPVVRSVYSTVRQITDAFWNQENTFKRVVLVEYPRTGTWAIGFITGELQASRIGIDAKDNLAYNVFLPTTPNPTSGWLLIYPAEDVRMLDISIEDGLKLIISGGVVLPDSLQNEPRGASTSAS